MPSKHSPRLVLGIIRRYNFTGYKIGKPVLPKRGLNTEDDFVFVHSNLAEERLPQGLHQFNMTRDHTIITTGLSKPHIADACSCTTCDSLDCFAYRFDKCCAKCNISITSVVYANNKISLNEHSDTSVLVAADDRKIPSQDLIYTVKTDTLMEESKYTDLEVKIKEKIDSFCKSTWTIEKPKNIMERIEDILSTDKDRDAGAKLSAQGINLSYKDFKQTQSYNTSDVASFKRNKVSKYDIFQRIKDVYRACSCKVCECIAGRSTRNELCKCKPCECSDCLSHLEKLQQPDSGGLYKHCSCRQFEKNTLSGIANTLNDGERCGCDPCDCIECADRFTKSCSCEPCQCIECKAMLGHRTKLLISAPAVEDCLGNSCQCSPCECIECEHRYGLSYLNRETSTGMNRQMQSQCRCEICLNEAYELDGSCKCEKRHRVMRKPVERDPQEYDIRRLLVNNTFRCDKSNRHDTIAMFAAVSNKYPRFDGGNTRQCTCDDCECIVCSYKEDAVNSIKSSQLFTPNKLQEGKTRLNARKNCKCQPCECEVCKYRRNKQTRLKKCMCDVCECVVCRARRTSFDRQVKVRGDCTCRSCECSRCDKIMSRRNRQPAYDKCRICRICKRCIRDRNNSEVTYSAKTDSTSRNTSLSTRDSKCNMKSQSGSLSVYRAFPELDSQTSPPKTTTQSYGTIRRASLTDLKRGKMKCPKSYNTLNCDACTQYKRRNKSMYRRNSVEYKGSGSYLTDSSSIKSNSKTSSYYKYTGSGTPVSGHKNKSCDSFCNSSGYDGPEYLVQFPKSTVETCLKDVMKLNLDKNIKLDKIKIVPNAQYRKHYVESASYENSSSGRQRISQWYEEYRSYKQLIKPVEIKGSSHVGRTKRNSSEYRNDDKPSQQKNTRKNSSYSSKYEKKPPCGTCAPCRTTQDTGKDNRGISIYITKNTATQTGEDGAAHVTKSTSSIITNRHDRNNCDRKDFQIAKALKEFRISRNLYDYNVINHEICNVTANENFNWRYPDKNFLKSTDMSKIDEDYNRVQKTLQDAKIFTFELMKILAKYEKENSEFESIADKLKLSQNYLLDNSLTKKREICDAGKFLKQQSDHKSHYSNENELREIHLEAPSVEQNTSQVIPKNVIKNKSNEGRIIFQKSRDPSKFNNLNANRFIMVIMPRENSKDLKENEIFSLIQGNTHSVEVTMTPHKENEIHDQKSMDPMTNPLITKRLKGRTRKIICRNYNKRMKRAVVVSKKITVGKKYDLRPAVISASAEACSTSVVNTEMAEDKVTSASISTTVVGQSITVSEGTDMKSIELRRVMHKLDAVFGTATELSVSTSMHELGQRGKEKALEGSTTIQTQDLALRKPWPILKKNYKLVDKGKRWQGKGVCILPSLDLEVKDAVQSLQTGSKQQPRMHVAATQSQHDQVRPTIQEDRLAEQQHDKEESDVRKDTSNICRKSKLDLELKDPPKAMPLQTSLQSMDSVNKEIICDHFIYSKTEDIERQIKELLNLAVFQPMSKKLLHSDNPLSVIDGEPRLPRIESSKSSCDALKASSLGVRRVSDHTVLVKWNLPREISDVQGYELLVDGRAVQKVLSPSRCMAVITCLPRAERVLLTVRTITSLVAHTGHYPAASVVYQPRHK